MGFIIHKADLIVKNYFHDKIRHANITREQWMILSWLHDCEGINQKSLSELTYRDPAALAKTLDRMERDGLITRVRDQEDKRAFLIYLTESGRDLRNKVEPLAVETLNEVFKDFTEEEMEMLKKFLLRISG